MRDWLKNSGFRNIIREFEFLRLEPACRNRLNLLAVVHIVLNAYWTVSTPEGISKSSNGFTESYFDSQVEASF